jgi:hypothetical protein
MVVLGAAGMVCVDARRIVLPACLSACLWCFADQHNLIVDCLLKMKDDIM